jgi:hypothetical protein
MTAINWIKSAPKKDGVCILVQNKLGFIVAYFNGKEFVSLETEVPIEINMWAELNCPILTERG